MYTTTNFRTKKAVKEAIAAHATGAGRPVTCYSPGMYPAPTDGRIALEGPHYPEPHKWYGEGVVKNGVLVSIK